MTVYTCKDGNATSPVLQYLFSNLYGYLTIFTLLVMDVASVIKSLESFTLADLEKCKDKIAERILYIKNNVTPSTFVDFHDNFVQPGSTLYNDIIVELQSLNFNPSTDIAATIWLTSTGEDYIWFSANGNMTVKRAIDIAKFLAISQLKQIIISKYGCQINSCLVSYYKSGDSRTRYHSDDEKSLDKSQGLYVASFGAERTLDLNMKGKDGRNKPDFSLRTTDGSLYVMKPGCQEYCVHRVRSEPLNRRERYSLSFRCLLPASKAQAKSPTTPDGSTPTATTATAIVTPPPKNPTSHLGHTSSIPNTSTASAAKTASHPTPPPQAANPLRYKRKVRRTTVLFGTSITKYVHTKNMGFRGRKLINVSESGAKIKDISNNVRKFYEDDLAAMNNDVEKVIFNLGTNDIKHARSGVFHLKKYLSDLINMTKELFPAAVILFQSCLPIKCVYSYIGRNVCDFNAMLRDLCLDHNCVFVDCFRVFLSRSGSEVNANLYHDWLHLNNRGVGVLSTWLKFIVNENSFDRVVDNLLGIKFI